MKNNERIDEFISCLDKKIMILKKLKYVYTLYLKTMNRCLLSRKFEFKGLSFEKYYEYQKIKLKHLVYIRYGKTKEWREKGEYPVYGKDGDIVGYTNSPEYHGEYILINKTGEKAGDYFYTDSNFGANDKIIVVRSSLRMYTLFLFYFLNDYKLKRLKYTSDDKVIKIKPILNIMLNLPNFSQQIDIASFLDKIYDKKDCLDYEIELFEEFKQAIIEKNFRKNRHLEKKNT
ncbi:MAG: restriction endonuclease subunit S [Methanobrevibacter sp.]|jgi:type I restriction enzyme S subunit|nr:restriction endonuclease subunit S [Candidatus Methanoflexus mossambicus]